MHYLNKGWGIILKTLNKGNERQLISLIEIIINIISVKSFLKRVKMFQPHCSPKFGFMSALFYLI